LGTHERIRDAFLRSGWLIPVFLPLADVAGRAVFNTLSVIYVAWALASLPARIDVDKTQLALYVGMIAAFALSIPGSLYPLDGVERLVRYTLATSAFFFTLMALQASPDNLARLAKALAVSALVIVAVLYVQLGHYVIGDDFNPAQQLKEDNLPWLGSFLMLAVLRAYGTPKRQLYAAAFFLAILAYVLVSHGRAALFGLILATMLFMILVLRWRLVYVLFVPVALVITAVLLAPNFSRTTIESEGHISKMDRFTSGRSVLWRQALEHPPRSILTGVGLGNVEHHKDVVSIGAERVRHLHNFLMDAWYETGLLGLAALLAWLGYGFHQGIAVWKRGPPEFAGLAGACLAAAAAILGAGLFSFSYTSKQFTVYLPLLMAAMAWMHARSARRP